ncbi:MAG: cbb3-type cytochrome oxidase assembly protein CcoS [Sulfuricellaceae bacterium]|jgi:cbb3-type cytochrome oxidase maturation protein
MNGVLIYLLGMTVFIVVFAGLGFFWAVRSGQFEDMEGPAQRILMDDDDPMIPRRRLKDGEN